MIHRGKSFEVVKNFRLTDFNIKEDFRQLYVKMKINTC